MKKNFASVSTAWVNLQGERRELEIDGASLIEYSAIIELDDETTGYVRYGFDKQQVEKAVLEEEERLASQLNSVLSALVIVALLGLVLGTLGSGRLAHKISGLLHEVVDTVKDIAEGEGDGLSASTCRWGRRENWRARDVVQHLKSFAGIDPRCWRDYDEFGGCIR